jgi:hypothetical protein
MEREKNVAEADGEVVEIGEAGRREEKREERRGERPELDGCCRAPRWWSQVEHAVDTRFDFDVTPTDCIILYDGTLSSVHVFLFPTLLCGRFVFLRLAG